MKFRTYPEFSTLYPLTLKTFMMRSVSLYPNEIGLVYRNPDTGQYSRFTWQQWYQRSCQIARVLQELGVKAGKPGQPGNRVATMAMNHNQHLELYFAVPCIGAVLHAINMRLSLDHIVYTINHAEDRILLFDDFSFPILEQIYDRIRNKIEKFIYISDKPGKPETKIEPVYEYEEVLKKQPPEFEWPYLDENTYATLCYTTGTTGTPKGVLFTHRQLYLEALNVMLRFNWNNDPAALRFDESAVPIVSVPMYHVHAWMIPYYATYTAQKIVLPGRYTEEGFCELVEKEKVTYTAMVPTMLAMLVEYKDLKKYDMSSLKSIVCGAAVLPLGLKAKIEELIPSVIAATAGYGMTEGAPAMVGGFVKKTMKDLPKSKLDEVRVRAGLPEPGLEVEVVDDNGKPVPRDNKTTGEIVVRGPWIMEQYYKSPDKTAESWRDGWFHTGDVAKVDEDGYITIADRITNVIRSGAEMIPTMLLEELTATADFVLEATYVGVPDEKWGERPMAIIKPVSGATPSEEDIIKFLEDEGIAKGKITRWMLPDYIVFTDTIPRTSVGKYDKVAIKKQMDGFLTQAKRIHKRQ